MVLLTSSAVSVAISSSVVCIFTFLLFLSGYVLQQQTVRSLQEALRRPPERKPVPTLPPQFQFSDNNESAAPVVLGKPLEVPNTFVVDDRDSDQSVDRVQVPVEVQDRTGTQARLPADSPDRQKPGQDQLQDRTKAPESPHRLAYMFALLEPSDLCSALLFAKQYRSSSRLATEPSIVLLYPATWESDSSTTYTSTLQYMRDVQELYGLVYHPVQIQSTWEVNAQLLGELQWQRWGYDQALYLRSPGLLLDGKVLDAALTSPHSRKAWTPLNPSSGNNPDMLLVTPRGLQSPRRETRGLVVSAIAGQTGTNNAEDMTRDAAYVLFDEDHLDGTRNDFWYRDLLRQFDQGRRAVCAGSGIMDDGPRWDLKRSL
jgi:hypothetical protein